MGSSSTRAAVTLFLSLNLLFFSLVNACETNPSPDMPMPSPTAPKIATPVATPTPSAPKVATPIPTPTAPKIATPVATPTPTPTAPEIATPVATPTPTNYGAGKCPQDALKLGVCVNVLNLVNVVVGSPPTMPCCSLIQGLVDLEAALCLCTAIRANILGINLDVPVALSLVLNNCGKKMPSGFECS